MTLLDIPNMNDPSLLEALSEEELENLCRLYFNVTRPDLAKLRAEEEKPKKGKSVKQHVDIDKLQIALALLNKSKAA